MNANDTSNNAETYGNVSTIVPHPRIMDKGAIVTAAANAIGINSLRLSSTDQLGRIQASLV